MKKLLLLVLFYLSFGAFNLMYAQTCPTDLLSGQNLIKNGDFSDGFNDWSFTEGANGYKKFISGFSVPGYLYVGTGSQMSYFNSAFSAPFNGQSGVNSDKFLMIDGLCIPGVKIWQQKDIPIKPNTNYYFSFWINSLKDNLLFPGIVNLDVNGTAILTNIYAPLLGGANPAGGWEKHEALWNSGPNPPATVTISIEGNQTLGCDGATGESDFAIDNISFIPGCEYGAPGPQPNLGPDNTLCGKGENGILLNSGITPTATTVITWSDGTTSTGINAQTTLRVKTAGTYSVCVTEGGSCTKSDIIVITDKFAISLGADIQLCDPSSVTLDALFTGIDVTYKWFKNGVEAEGTNTNRTYFVNTEGTYKVEVTDPNCGMQFDEIIITSKAPKVTNKTYCNEGDLTLTVTPENDGKYKWWNSPTSINPTDLVQKGGDSFTFSAIPTTDYTFYVQDTSSFRITVGLPLTGNGLSGVGNRNVSSENELKFDVLTAITIDTIYIDLHTYGCPTKPVTLEVTDNLGNVVGTSASFSVSAAQGCIIANSLILKMPVGISVPVGMGYKLKMTAGENMNWYQNGMTYPQSFDDVITFTGNSTGFAPNAIPGMFRWVVTAGTACARVPVKALFKSCVPPVKPIAYAGTDIKLCNLQSTSLNAGSLKSDESGEWKMVAGSAGSITPSKSTSGVLTFTGDTVYVVWVVTNEAGVDRDTVMVTTTNVTKPIITAPSSTCPETTGLIFVATPDNTSTNSTYVWSVEKGDATIVSGKNTTELTVDAGFVESIIRVTETKNGCSAYSEDTLKLLESNNQAFAGTNQIICQSSTLLVGNKPAKGLIGTWTMVTLDPTVTLDLISQDSLGVKNLLDKQQYEFKYEISGGCGLPTSSIVKVTVGLDGFKITSVVQPSDTLCVGSLRELNVFVAKGSESFTYVWAKKGRFGFDSTYNSRYNITTSNASETYYVFVKDNIYKGCATSIDSVTITSVDFQKLFIPNLITPNGDGLNDVLKITEEGNTNRLMLADKSILKIYNSWGNEVFHSDNYNNNWNAAGLSDGVYYYFVKAGCGGNQYKSWIQILGNTK